MSTKGATKKVKRRMFNKLGNIISPLDALVLGMIVTDLVAGSGIKAAAYAQCMLVFRMVLFVINKDK